MMNILRLRQYGKVHLKCFLDVKNIANKRIVRLSNDNTIDIDICDSVKALKYQHDRRHV